MRQKLLTTVGLGCGPGCHCVQVITESASTSEIETAARNIADARPELATAIEDALKPVVFSVPAAVMPEMQLAA